MIYPKPPVGFPAVLLGQHDFLELWLAPMRTILGWSMVKLGHVEEGIGQVRQAVAENFGIRFTNFSPFMLAMYADILRDAGRIKEGLHALEEAIDASGTGMGYHEADIYRLKGELLLQRIAAGGTPDSRSPDFKEVESCFERAVATARRQQAKSFELRATVGLARLLKLQKRFSEARERLTSIYDWFTEGQGTPDLQEAGRLLREFSLDSK